MRYYVYVLVIILLNSACSRTTYTVSPSFGYTLRDSTRLIIAKFQNAPTDPVSEQATKLLQELYQPCVQVEVVPYDTVQNIFYRNVNYVDPAWKINTEFLVRLYETTRARYLLLGKVVGEANSRSPIEVADRYGTGQLEDIRENWIVLTFTLYDLATSQVAVELHTRTKAGQYNRPQDDGGVTSFYAPVNLFSKAFRKSMDKLPEVCGCQR